MSGTALPLNALEDNNSHQAGRLPPLHRQSFSPRSSLEDHIPLIPQFFFLYHPVFISVFFSLITNRTVHGKLLTMTHKKREGEGIKRRVKNSRKPRDTQSCLRVVVMFPSLGSIVCNCNQTSGGKRKSLFCYQNTGT